MSNESKIAAKRLDHFQTGIFAELNDKKDEMEQKGKHIYNLSVGTPDFEPPKHIMDAVLEAASKPENYKYSLRDIPELLEAVSAYYKRRFGVEIATDQITGVHGTQEGMGHVGMALLDEGDLVLLPNPGYPIFEAGSYLSGADMYFYDLKEENDFLPHNYTRNCVCYTGTHDNDTTMGWYQTLKPALQDRVRRYLNTDGNIIHYDMIRAAMGHIARYAVYPIHDILGYGSDCRMNTPSVAGGNWAFRFRKDHLTPELAANLRKMTELFGRCEPLEPIEEEEGPEGSIKPGETAAGLDLEE